MAKTPFDIQPGQVLTVTPVGDVQVYFEDGAAGGFLAAPTTYGPYSSARKIYVDGSFTASVSDIDSEAFRGSFVADGTTPVSVPNANVLISDAIIISLETIGGTVGASPPTVDTITAGVGFTVKALVGDTSVYNYAIIRNAT